jgi:hypothetical protein
MTSLLQIVPLTETIQVRGIAITIRGLSARGIGHLLARFPALRELMGGTELSSQELFDLGGDIVAAIIAAGCGSLGDAKAEAVADHLTVEEQTDLLSAIVRLTMPGGIGPFVEKLGSIGTALNISGNSSESDTAPAAAAA